MSSLILPRTHLQGVGRPLMELDYSNPITRGLVEVGNPSYSKNNFIINNSYVDVLGISFGKEGRSAYLPHSGNWKPTNKLTVLVWLGSILDDKLNSFICGCESPGYGWGIYVFLGSLSARVQTTQRNISVGISAGNRVNNVLGFTWDGVTLRTWRGGKFVKATTLGGTLLYDESTLDINGKGGGVDSASSHNVMQLCIWDRDLSAEEIANVSNYPFQIFKQVNTLIEV